MEVFGTLKGVIDKSILTIIHQPKKRIAMKTLQTIKKRIKNVAQKQNAFVGNTINMYNYDDTLLTRIGRYTYQIN